MITTLSASVLNLQRLAIIRSLLLAVLSGLVIYAYHWLGLPIHFSGLLITLLILTAITTVTLWRCQRPWPVTDQEFFGQLLVDIVGLSVLLYLSGGATNPFVSYYLVPLCIAALILPWGLSWLLAGCSLAAYSLLLFYYLPLPDITPDHGTHNHHGHNSTGLNLHIIGMWFNFAISAVLITFFVVRMAHALRQREEQLAEQREDELRDEQVMAVATLAAGTAHELGTPLSTMIVLLDEINDEHRDNPDLNQDIQLLQQQVQSCRSILKGLVRTAETHSLGQHTQTAIDTFLKKTLERWQVLRPTASYQLSITSNLPAPLIAVDSTLEQALTNLLNNAADASDSDIEVQLQWNKQFISVSVRDYGPGISSAITEQLGKPYVTTKGKGLGLGLFLSHATIKRYGGSIRLYNHPENGCIAELRLPVNAEETFNKETME